MLPIEKRLSSIALFSITYWYLFARSCSLRCIIVFKLSIITVLSSADITNVESLCNSIVILPGILSVFGTLITHIQSNDISIMADKPRIMLAIMLLRLDLLLLIRFKHSW